MYKFKKMAGSSKKPSIYEEFRALKSNALSYDVINREKESGNIKEDELRNYAGNVAPDQFVQAYLKDKKTPISETYPFLEAGYKRFTRLADKMGNAKLEAIIDSTPKVNLKRGLNSINPDSKNAGDYADAAKNHKTYLEMYEVLAVYQDKDAEDEDRKKATETILKKIKSHYDKVLADDEPEVKGATQWLLENSDIFAGNMYAMMYQKAQHDFNEAIKGKEKEYLKTILANDNYAREMFYRIIIQEPKKQKEDKE